MLEHITNLEKLMNYRFTLVAAVLITFTAGVLPSLPAQARGRATKALYHATSKKAAKSISKTGKLDMKKASAKARYGKGAYFARSKRGAIKERGLKNPVVFKARVNKCFSRRSWRVSQWGLGKLRGKSKVGKKSLRGARKKGVVGPKLGRKLGKAAGKKGRGISYRPKGPRMGKGNNLFVPPQTYDKGRAVGKLTRVR